jgi:hypothetical protein
MFLLILSVFLKRRMTRQLNAKFPEGDQIRLSILADGSNVSSLHHENFPSSHLGLAWWASIIGAALLMIAWAATRVLIP